MLQFIVSKFVYYKLEVLLVKACELAVSVFNQMYINIPACHSAPVFFCLEFWIFCSLPTSLFIHLYFSCP